MSDDAVFLWNVQYFKTAKLNGFGSRSGAGGQAGQTGRQFFPQTVHGREDGGAISGWHGAQQDRQCTGSSHGGFPGA